MLNLNTNKLNANQVAKLLLTLERHMDALVAFIDSPQCREAYLSPTWRTNEALCDLDRVLSRTVDDFLLGGELYEALLSLDGEADSQEYRAWLTRYRKADKDLDAHGQEIESDRTL